MAYKYYLFMPVEAHYFYKSLHVKLVNFIILYFGVLVFYTDTHAPNLPRNYITFL